MKADPIKTLASLKSQFWAQGVLRRRRPDKDHDDYCVLGWLMHSAGVQPVLGQMAATPDQLETLVKFYEVPMLFFLRLPGINDDAKTLGAVKKEVRQERERIQV